MNSPSRAPSVRSHRSSGKVRVRTLLIAALGAFFLWLGSSAIVAWRLTRRGALLDAEPVPAWAAGRIEEIRLDTPDGERLGAWFFPRPGARAVVLVLHGNDGSRSCEAELLRWISEQDLAVLATTLRAHGDSTGSANDFGWGARHDIVASVAFLEIRDPEMPIVVYGCSLGAAAAIYAARELGTRVSGYALEAPYRDLRSATRHRLRMFLPPVLDEVAFAGLSLMSPAMLEPEIALLAPIDHVDGIPTSLPVVFLSGTNDRHAPMAEVQEILARCSGCATLVEFPGAGHGELRFSDPNRFRKALLDLVSAASRP